MCARYRTKRHLHLHGAAHKQQQHCLQVMLQLLHQLQLQLRPKLVADGLVSGARY